jgi:hypothetical protein
MWDSSFAGSPAKAAKTEPARQKPPATARNRIWRELFRGIGGLRYRCRKAGRLPSLCSTKSSNPLPLFLFLLLFPFTTQKKFVLAEHAGDMLFSPLL